MPVLRRLLRALSSLASSGQARRRRRERLCAGAQLRGMDAAGLRDLGIGVGEVEFWLRERAPHERRP